MSLGIAIKGPEGIALAAESRITLTSDVMGGPTLQVNFDNATKLFSFAEPHDYVGVVTYGLAAIGMRTAHSFVPEFEASLPDKRIDIVEFAELMRIFYLNQWAQLKITKYTGPKMTLLVCGFNKDEPYGKIYHIDIPGHSTIEEYHSDGFGITWGGQRNIVDRLLKGYDQGLLEIAAQVLNLQPKQKGALIKELGRLGMSIPLNAMALQDYVDLAVFFLRTTIAAQTLSVGIRGCGGAIDVATITRRDAFSFIQRKEIHGEASSLQ